MLLILTWAGGRTYLSLCCWDASLQQAHSMKWAFHSLYKWWACFTKRSPFLSHRQRGWGERGHYILPVLPLWIFFCSMGCTKFVVISHVSNTWISYGLHRLDSWNEKQIAVQIWIILQYFMIYIPSSWVSIVIYFKVMISIVSNSLLSASTIQL